MRKFLLSICTMSLTMLGASAQLTLTERLLRKAQKSILKPIKWSKEMKNIIKYILIATGVIIQSLYADTYAGESSDVYIKPVRFQYDDVWYQILSEEDKTVEVCCWEGARAVRQMAPDRVIELIDVEIPEKVEYNGVEYSVVQLGFRSVANLFVKRLIIPESVVRLGKNVFQDCIIGEVVFPDSYIEYGGGTFYNPTPFPWDYRSIGSYSAPESSPVFAVKNKALYTKDFKTLLSYPDSGGELADELEIIDAHAAKTSSVRSIVIPSKVKEIGEEAFGFCSSLKEVIIRSMCNIKADAFYFCKSLESVVWEIEEGASESTSGHIGYYAFGGCESLKNVEIPHYIKTIGEHCFEGCTSLESVTLGKNVKTLGIAIFSYCTGLENIYCKSTVPPQAPNLGIVCSGKNLYVPEESAELYRKTAPWSGFNIIPVSGVETIGADGQEGTEAEVWYTTSGVRVDKPEHGVYVRVRGSGSERVFIP